MIILAALTAASLISLGVGFAMGLECGLSEHKDNLKGDH